MARAAGRPWFLLYNIPNSHRPYPNSDKLKIRVNPARVKLPAFLPDTPVVRQDWAEYLAAIEETDIFVGEALDAILPERRALQTVIEIPDGMVAAREFVQLGQRDRNIAGQHGPAHLSCTRGSTALYSRSARRLMIMVRSPATKSMAPMPAS